MQISHLNQIITLLEKNPNISENSDSINPYNSIITVKASITQIPNHINSVKKIMIETRKILHKPTAALCGIMWNGVVYDIDEHSFRVRSNKFVKFIARESTA